MKKLRLDPELHVSDLEAEERRKRVLATLIEEDEGEDELALRRRQKAEDLQRAARRKEKLGGSWAA